jgi:hypothetical protein
MGALPGYFYSTNAKGLYVNLYGSNTLDWRLANGTALRVTESTGYPWKGNVDLAVDPVSPSEFSLFLRIPEWSHTTRLIVNGTAVAAQPGRFAEIHRTWKAGDHVSLALDMHPRLTEANALVRENAGRVAVERGPLVYCLEKGDQPLAADLFDDSLLVEGLVEGRARFTETFHPELLDGVLTLEHKGVSAAKPLEDDPLYRDFSMAGAQRGKAVTLTFIPYYAWANRGQQEMEVWVPVARGAKPGGGKLSDLKRPDQIVPSVAPR